MSSPSLTNESRTASSSKQRSPLVSIVTPSYNQAHFIDKTIRSVLLQDYLNLEYIVMDSMSADGTAEIMAKYEKDGRMIRAKDDGQSDAIDKGFRICSGDILAYLNSDDCYSSPKVVSRVVQLFEENPDVDVIIGKREFIDEAGYYVLNYPFRPFDSSKLLESCYVPQECAFWRKSIYEKAGNCVDKTFRFAMDYDLWLRFLAAKAKFLAVDEYFGLFRWYPGQKSTDIWQKHGVPEIAKLQKRHLGHAMPEDEMIAIYQEYWYGSNRLNHLDTYKHSVPTWQTFTSYKKEMLRGTTRDAWVYLEHLSIPKRQISVSAQSASAAVSPVVDGAGDGKAQQTPPDGSPVVATNVASLEQLVQKYGAFDEKYYRSQLQESVSDALEHFHTVGFRRALNPHPLFDTHFYLETNPDVKQAGIDPLEHWLRSGADEGRAPHRLFDAKYFRSLDTTLLNNLDAFHQYQLRGRNSDLSPHPLFDQVYYKRQRNGNTAPATNPLTDYLLIGHKLGLDPHPLFSTNFYRSSIGGEAASSIEPLTHYLRIGYTEGRNPHPLIDSAFYNQHRGADEQRSCLERFLQEVEPVAPHPAFSPAYYATQAKRSFAKPSEALIHYLASGWKDDLNPYPLFDTAFYKSQFARRAEAVVEPLSHYMTVGYKSGFDPHPLFDTEFYLEQRPALKTGYMSPLTHYITRGLNYKTNPHPLFDTVLYESCEPQAYRDDTIPPLVRYLSCAYESGVDPNENFDTDYYVSQNPHLSKDVSPLQHYLEHKDKGGSASSPFFDAHFHKGNWSSFVSAVRGRVFWIFEERSMESNLDDVAKKFVNDTFISVAPTSVRYRGGSKKFRGLIFKNKSQPDIPELVFHPVRQVELCDLLFDEMSVTQIILLNFLAADQSLQLFLDRLKRPFNIFIAASSAEVLLTRSKLSEQRFVDSVCERLDAGSLEVGTNFEPANIFNWKVSRSWFLRNAEQTVSDSDEILNFIRSEFLSTNLQQQNFNVLVDAASSKQSSADSRTSSVAKKKTIRFGVPCRAGSAWTGGIYYLNNLLAAVKGVDDEVDLQCVLLTRAGEEHRSLSSGLKNWHEIFELSEWSADAELASANLDFVFSSGDLFESHTVPVISWLYDFQHKELPSLFSADDLVDRDRLFDSTVLASRLIVLSSNHAKNVFAQHYPEHVDKVRVLQFTPQLSEDAFTESDLDIRAKYSLPERFFYLPNQFWLHKNHECVIEALALLKKEGKCPTVVCTGSINDSRDPAYFSYLLNKIAVEGLVANLVILGFVPRRDVLELMKQCTAVLQPSLYEGWSTSVEESKALDKVIVLSDIPVHREQSPERGLFFNPFSAKELAEVMRKASILAQVASPNYCDMGVTNLGASHTFGLNVCAVFMELAK